MKKTTQMVIAGVPCEFLEIETNDDFGCILDIKTADIDLLKKVLKEYFKDEKLRIKTSPPNEFGVIKGKIIYWGWEFSIFPKDNETSLYM